MKPANRLCLMCMVVILAGFSRTTPALCDTSDYLIRAVSLEGIRCIDVSADGAYLVAGMESGKAHVYDTTTWQIVGTAEGHTQQLNAVAFAPNGYLFATGSEDSLVKLWRGPDPQYLATLDAAGSVHHIAFSPDDVHIAIGADRAEVWNRVTQERIGRYSDSTGDALAFTPDGSLLIGHYGGASRIRVWETEMWYETTSWRAGVNLTDLAAGRTGLVAYCNWDWDSVPVRVAATGELVAILDSGATYSLSFSPSGRILATGDARRLLDPHEADVKIWVVGADRVAQIATFEGHTSTIRDVCFDPLGRWIASCATDDGFAIWAIPQTDE